MIAEIRFYTVTVTVSVPLLCIMRFINSNVYARAGSGF